MSQILAVHFDKVIIKFNKGRRIVLKNIGITHYNVAQFIHEDGKITEISTSMVRLMHKWPSMKDCYYDTELHKIIFGKITESMRGNPQTIFGRPMIDEDEPVKH